MTECGRYAKRRRPSEASRGRANRPHAPSSAISRPRGPSTARPARSAAHRAKTKSSTSRSYSAVELCKSYAKLLYACAILRTPLYCYVPDSFGGSACTAMYVGAQKRQRPASAKNSPTSWSSPPSPATARSSLSSATTTRPPASWQPSWTDQANGNPQW